MTQLFFLSVPGFDWRIAQPLVDDGVLPNLEALIEGGVIGNVATPPPLSWPVPTVSLLTGTLADKHRIFSPFVPVEAETGEKSITVFGMRNASLAPFWTYLAQSGKTCAHVGWPGMYPVPQDTDITGVSDMFAHAKGKTFDAWPLDEAALSADLPRDVFADLRLHPVEVTQQMLLPFLEHAETLDLETDTRASMIVSLLARLSTLHGAATWILEHRRPDVLSVHFDYLQHLSSLFIGYAAPQLEQVTDHDHALYGKVTEGAYRFLDMLLARYRDLLDADANIVIVSAHGMRIGDMRAAPRLDGSVNASEGYRPLGAVLGCGPRLKADDLISGARIQDVAPTLMALLGVDAGEQMEGQALKAFFAEPLDEPRHAPQTIQTQAATTAAPIAQYLAEEWTRLGLIKPLREGAEEMWEIVSIQNALAEAALLMSRHTQHANERAKAALEGVLAIMPDQAEALVRLCQLALRRGDIAACQDHLGELRDSGLSTFMTSLLEAQSAILSKDEDTARKALDKAKAQADRFARPIRYYDQLGNSWLVLKDAAKARSIFEQAKDIDPDDPLINAGLGLSAALEGDDAAAVEAFQASLAVLHEQPRVHYSMGRALARLGQLEPAIKSFATAIKLNPKDKRAKASFDRLTRELAQNLSTPA
ncbi:MAG: alkaline phosphatase family protein [Pseudomonadota bacterium]